MKEEIRKGREDIAREMKEFERCKRQIDLTIKISQLKLKQFTGRMLSGDDGEITPTDGEKKIPANLMCGNS